MANFDDQLNNISRRRAMADMLSKQGRGLQSQLGQTQFAGGYAIPTQGVESANAILSQLLGAYFDNKYAKEETETKEKQRQDMKEWAMMLNEVGKPSEIQPVTVGYGPSPERLSPEVKAGIDATNRGAQDIMVEDKQRQQNEVMSHLLSGLDKGGYAAQIAGTQLANQLSPMERKPVSGVPGVTMDSRGNFYDTSGNMLDSQTVQEIASRMRKSGATTVNVGTDQAIDQTKLLEQLATQFPDATYSELRELVQQASATGQLPQRTPPSQRPEKQYNFYKPEDLESNPSLRYVDPETGETSQEGRAIITQLAQPETQDKIMDNLNTNAEAQRDIQIIIDAVESGGFKVGPGWGSALGKGAQLVGDVTGLYGEKASEAISAFKRLQTAAKLAMIGESGVRAFDTPLEMQSLFQSIANEAQTTDALLESLRRIDSRYEKEYQHAKNAWQLLDVTPGLDPLYPMPEYQDFTVPEPGTVGVGDSDPVVEERMTPDGRRIVKRQSGKIEIIE